MNLTSRMNAGVDVDKYTHTWKFGLLYHAMLKQVQQKPAFGVVWSRHTQTNIQKLASLGILDIETLGIVVQSKGE